MVEVHNHPQPTQLEHLVYAPRLRIELMNECDHAAVPTIVKGAVTQTMAEGGEGSDLCVHCPACCQPVDVRVWHALSGEWYLRLRERFAAARAWMFHYRGGAWVTDW